MLLLPPECLGLTGAAAVGSLRPKDDPPKEMLLMATFTVFFVVSVFRCSIVLCDVRLLLVLGYTSMAKIRSNLHLAEPQ